MHSTLQRVAATLVAAFAFGGACAQESPAGPYARMVVIEPLPGQAAAFREGYGRHLAWHREANDPWTWYGWTFVLGERLGLFMDGTFGHAAEVFDQPVDPAGDAADNAANVTPYAVFRQHGVYERLDDLNAGAPLPDESPYLAVTTYVLEAGREQAFRSMVADRRRAAEGSGRYTWFRLRIGGRVPQYLLFRPAASFGAAARLGEFFAREGDGGSGLSGTVREIRHELLRFEPGLSYAP